MTAAVFRTVSVSALTAAGLAMTLSACAGTDSDAAPAQSSTPTPARTADGETPRPSSTGGDYADGQYQATGWYGGLPSHLEVSITLQGDIITAVTVTPTATNATSLDYQQRFAAAVPDVVVGRDIDEVHVTKLAGSSGCPDGFNDALEKIKSQAAA